MLTSPFTDEINRDFCFPPKMPTENLRNLYPRLVHCFKYFNKNLYKSYCNVFNEEFTVQTFCDVRIKLPYNVQIRPLDVHKNCDKLKIELVGLESECRSTIKHIQDGNNIKIFTGTQEYNENVTCSIKVPVKANLNVTSDGNISTGFCNGSKLILNSTKGNIIVDKYHGEKIDLTTETGDIILKGPVVAADINAVILKNGSIKTKRLQGLNAQLKTNKGNIHVDSSYCDDAKFETECGNLELQNIHKNSKIYAKNGNVNLNGLDGHLEAVLENTKADIQLSRISNDSEISIKEKGELTLRISQECQENTMFKIQAKDHILDPSVKLIPSKNNDILYLTPYADYYKQVNVKCEKCSVQILSTSWAEMLKLNVQK